MSSTTIGFAGMSHLGLNSAAAAAEKGFTTICFDSSEKTIRALRDKKLPVSEPGLDEMIARNNARLRFTYDPHDLASCDVIYVSLDVHTDDKGASDLGPVRALIGKVQEVAGRAATLVVFSQVPPGFCRGLGGSAARTYYQVETLIFGRAVERALHPERFIVGMADPAQLLPPAYRRFLEAFNCPILTMRYESAELAKIAINTFLVSSVSTTNMLAEVCERIGAVWHEIAPALRLDRRIGPHAYLAPGLGIAGGNLERDLATVTALGNAHGTDVRMVQAWRDNSRHRADWVLHNLHRADLARPKALFAVLGLAYKENTHSTKNSPSLSLLAALKPFAVAVYDPLVTPSDDWHLCLRNAASAIDACQGADAAIIMTPWPQFRELEPRQIAAKLKGNVVLDPFGCLDHDSCIEAGLTHLALGIASVQPGAIRHAVA